MAKPKIVLNHSGIGQVLKSAEVATELHRRAERAAAAARASAPVASGAYLASIEVVDEVHKDRVVSKVVADVGYAMTIEANSGNLARSLDAAGGA
jgi:dihydroxyacetone kinase DhaKLM complex PTS-EIIA-like component DhaM